MTELPNITRCRYCGSDNIILKHLQYDVMKGVTDVQDIRCGDCHSLLFGISKLIQNKVR